MTDMHRNYSLRKYFSLSYGSFIEYFKGELQGGLDNYFRSASVSNYSNISIRIGVYK